MSEECPFEHNQYVTSTEEALGVCGKVGRVLHHTDGARIIAFRPWDNMGRTDMIKSPNWSNWVAFDPTSVRDAPESKELSLKEEYEQIEAEIEALEARKLSVLRKSLGADEEDKVFSNFFVGDFLNLGKGEMTFPRTIQGISWVGPNKGWMSKRKPKLVRVRPASGDETYLGILVCELPLSVMATLPSTGVLNIEPSLYNPAIVVPALGSIVMGSESWWGDIETEDDLKGITDETIQNAPYMKLLATLLKTEDDADE